MYQFFKKYEKEERREKSAQKEHGKDIPDDAPEQKLRTQRILGNLIREGQKRGEITTIGNPDFVIIKEINNSKPKTLPEIGIARNEKYFVILEQKRWDVQN